MSNNHTSTPQKLTKVIEVGKFYFVHDGSKTGHPGLIISIDETANRYLLIRFDSDKLGAVPKKSRGIKHITKLKHPTESTIMNSYVHNRPMLCKRRDIGIELTRLSINEEDMQVILEVSKQKPELSPSIKK